MKTDPDDNTRLVARCRSGDASAWQALVLRYQRLVYAIARRTGLDEHLAADVFQTVFARLIQHLDRLEDPSRLQAWIVTATRREALQQRASARRLVSMTADDDDGEGSMTWEMVDDSPIAEDVLDRLQQLHTVREGLERLDERCRDLLLMLFRDEDELLSYQEIGSRLNLPVGSIGPTRSRCLDKLRRSVS